MREREIGATSMNVYLRAKIMYRHCTTLDMPAGTAWSPGTRPRRFARSLCLPEDKIERILLARIIGMISTLISDSEHGRIIIQTNRASHDAEIRVTLNTEIDVALIFICIPTRQ